MNIGFIARADNSGLGTLSWEFANHLKPHKALIVNNGVYQMFPERYAGIPSRVTKRNFSKADIEWLLDGTDILFIPETPYDPQLYVRTRQAHVKTVLMPMYESFKPEWDRPDFFMCPSLLDLQEIPEPKQFLPFPVNRKRLPFTQRKTAEVFLHNAGHGGMVGRNGTQVFIDAIPMVKADVKFIINCQMGMKLPYEDSRVTLKVGNYQNYWDVWNEGDVFVFPERFNGLSLPINEALSKGMVVMSTDRFPFNKWLPTEPLIPAHEIVRSAVSATMLDYAIVKPEAIAKKIDEFAHADISKLSEQSNTIAQSISWEVLLPEYIKTFKKLLNE